MCAMLNMLKTTMKTKVNPSWVRIQTTEFRNNISGVLDFLDEMEIGCVLTRYEKDTFVLQPIGQIEMELSPSQKELIEKQLQEVIKVKSRK